MYDALLDSCARAADAATREFQARNLWALAVLAAALVTIVRNRLRSRSGLWIGAGHPLLREAAERARATLPLLLELHAAHPNEVAVKFRQPAATETSELVWGRVVEFDATHCTATVDSTPLSGDWPRDSRVRISLEELLDWQYTPPDGPVRGGFSTQAEIRICRQRRQRPPPHIASLQGRFVDV